MLNHGLFAKEMTKLCELYERQGTKALLDVYYDALKDLTDEQFKTAVQSVIKDRKYSKLPMPGDFRPDKDADAVGAWEKVGKAIDRYGSYQSVSFEDKLIMRVISSLGGWIRVCRSIPEDTLRREFVKTYAALRGTTGLAPAYLPGDGADERIGYLGKEDVVMIPNDGAPGLVQIEAPKGEADNDKVLEVHGKEDGQGTDMPG